MTGSEKKSERFRWRRTVSLYIQFERDAYPDLAADALERLGASVWEIDEDVDLEHYPQGGIFHPAAVFRVRLRKDGTAEELMAAAAHLPEVHSVTKM